MPKLDPRTITDVLFGDSPALDSFGRLRTSPIDTLFDSVFEYTVQPTLWKQTTAGAGAVTHVQLESSMKLSVGTLSGDKATHETKGYHRYQPGKSQLFMASGLIGAPKAGVVSRIGYFDDDNGVFFMQTESGINVVIRSDTSGAPVDTVVAQTSWNLDRLNGHATSRVELDPSKMQIFVIDLQWLGVGRVRFGFHFAGEIVYCHEFVHANKVLTAFMRTCNLPIRYEIENIAATSTATEIKQVCSMVASEGGFNAEGFIFSQHTVVAPPTINTRLAVLSIRPTATFGGISNRVLIAPNKWTAFADSNDAVIEIIKGGVLGGAPTWNPADASGNSAVEYSLSNVTVTGGTIVDSDFALAGGNINVGFPSGSDFSLLSRFVHGLENGAVQEVLSIVATPAGNAEVGASLRWKEYY
jgi:hypothetical protein